MNGAVGSRVPLGARYRSSRRPRLVLGGLCVAVVARVGAVRAQDPVAPPAEAPPVPALHLELPIVDVPFTFANHGAWPSMEQSLWVTAGLYQGIHYGIGRVVDPFAPAWGRRLLAKVVIAATDVLTVALPGLLAWQHEEWHRAVMSLRGINSHNDVYNLEIFAQTIAVSHVTDEDLIRLKAEHPADMVRLATAGIEGNYAGAHALETLTFFQETRSWNTALLWLLYIQNSGYMSTCAGAESDRLTNDERAAEGADVARRDFTGLDCNGWTYDLFRPDEPYAARGVHPSGVGIDRYRTYGTMAPEEQAYLRQQASLSLLNFIDPNLIGINRIEWPWPVRGAPVHFNLALRHLPTAFGYDLRVDLFVKRQETLNVLLSLHGYSHQSGILPGVEAQIFRLPVGRLAGRPLLVGLRGGAWLQPQRLRYVSDTAEFGGLGAVRVGWDLFPALAPYLEIEAKTQGWVAGNVFLERNVSARAGISARIF